VEIELLTEWVEAVEALLLRLLVHILAAIVSVSLVYERKSH
jgi:hypothetical protein